MFWTRNPQLDSTEKPRGAALCWVYSYGKRDWPRLIVAAFDAGQSGGMQAYTFTIRRRLRTGKHDPCGLPFGLFSDFAIFLQELERLSQGFPTAAEIAERAASVRQEWSDHEFTKRSGHDPTWEPPTVSVTPGVDPCTE